MKNYIIIKKYILLVWHKFDGDVNPIYTRVDLGSLELEPVGNLET